MGHSQQWYKFNLRKQEKYQISNLTLHQKQLEKEEKAKRKVSRNIGIIKIRVDFF